MVVFRNLLINQMWGDMSPTGIVFRDNPHPSMISHAFAALFIKLLQIQGKGKCNNVLSKLKGIKRKVILTKVLPF